jgi:Tol biopolymer transport system component
MNANGTNAHQITPTAFKADDPKWSPDGTTILFDSYGSPPAKSRNIYSIKPDGTELTQLTRYSGSAQQAYMDSWSPDGTQIVLHVRGSNPNGPGVNRVRAGSDGG